MKITYHHGNLRQAVIDQAGVILAEEGLASLSLRGIAKAVGVSGAALYSHFQNKDALLEAMAVQGYLQLQQYLTESEWYSGFSLIEQLAIAYVSFALDHPHLFRLMFGRELAILPQSAEREQAAGLCFQPIYQEVSRMLRQSARQLQVEDAAISAWAIVHGLATLMMDGKVQCPVEPAARQQRIVSLCQPLILGLS